MSHRSSKYLVCGVQDVHAYPVENKFHYNPRSESVWTEEERAALLHQVASATASNAEKQWEAAHEVVPTHSEMECYMQYMNVDDPSINNSEWSADEDHHLLELVEKYSEHEWCHIAEELGTHRTPIACLRHYQQTLNTKLLNNSEWSAEEDLLLKQAVETCGKGKWQKVSTYVPDRSSTQCMNRWAQSNCCQENVVAGRWLEQEERLLFLAAVAYDAPRMQQFKKTDAQLRELYVSAGLEQDSNNAGRGSGNTVTGFGGANTNGAESSDSEDEHVSNTGATTTVTTTSNNTNTASNTQPTNAVSTAAPATTASFAYWKEMAAMVPGKTDVQCREKWLNTLDPTVNAAPYSTPEDVRLVRVVYALQKSSSGGSGGGSVGGGVVGGVGGGSSAGTSSGAGLVDGIDTNTVPSAPLDSTSVHSLLSHTDPTVPTKWAKVAQYMPGRTDASVRSRWMLLLKGYTKSLPTSDGEGGKRKAPPAKRQAAAHPNSKKRAKGGS